MQFDCEFDYAHFQEKITPIENKKTIHIEAYSFNNESFHIFRDSNSSNTCLSNASAWSFGDTLENSSPRMLSNSHLESYSMDLLIVDINMVLALLIQPANLNKNLSLALDLEPPSYIEYIC